MPTTVASAVLLEGLRRPADDQAWRQFCDRYEPMLLAFARRSGFGEHDARDVVQSTLMSFLEGFRAGRYESDRGGLKAWLRGIAANKIKEAYRNLARREAQVVDRTTSTAFMNQVPDDRRLTDIFAEEWERSIMAECLREVRRQVHDTTFQSFRLFVMKNWPAEDVADHLGISRDAVYSNKRRVVSRLRQLAREMPEIW
jgi:RNA polymerase sigma factor (sigma-70 family)